MSSQPAALQLRLLQTVVAVAAEKNSTLVLPFPVELLRFLERAQQPGQQTELQPRQAVRPPQRPAQAPAQPERPAQAQPERTGQAQPQPQPRTRAQKSQSGAPVPTPAVLAAHARPSRSKPFTRH